MRVVEARHEESGTRDIRIERPTELKTEVAQAPGEHVGLGVWTMSVVAPNDRGRIIAEDGRVQH
jgi:hypothetical protein